MSDECTVIIRGNVVADAEPRVTGSGKKVASFRVATNTGHGETKRTSYHNVQVWEDLAEEANLHARKGTRVFIEGRGTSGSYESKKHPGEKVYTYDIVADRVIYGTADDGDADLPTAF